jgi:hypothetical protein
MPRGGKQIAAQKLSRKHGARKLQSAVRMAQMQRARAACWTAVLRLPGNLGFKRLLVKQHGQPRAGARHKEPVHRSCRHGHLKRHCLLLQLRPGRPVPKDDRGSRDKQGEILHLHHVK